MKRNFAALGARLCWAIGLTFHGGNMRSAFFAAIFLLSSVSFADPTSDVFIRRGERSGDPAPALTDLTQCRARIKTIVCAVEPPKKGEDRALRPCSAGGERFAPFFEAHFDHSSELIQRMYCHVDKLWVEKEFHGTAYASPMVDKDGKVVAGGVGIRQEVLDSNLTFDQWLSWKEETSFGGGTKTSDKPLGLIQYFSNRNTKEYFLDYVLNHEFGHLFDFANDLNHIVDCEFKKDADGKWRYVGSCVPKPGSWTALSWQNRKDPVAGADFPIRSELCFYACYGHFIDRKNAVSLFTGLTGSPYQSTYAASNYVEDFAETFASKIAYDSGFRYGLNIGGQSFDMSAHYAAPVMQPKRDYINKFLSGKIVYPGE